MSNVTRKPMRQGQQNRRGRGRSRKPQNPLSRNLESNGPDVKIRGTASHIAEKYTVLARDAQVSGDSVAGESYFQHAEHYNRIIMSNQAQQQATMAAQAEGMNGSSRDQENASAEEDGHVQPETAPVMAASNNTASGTSASDKGATDAMVENTADAKITVEKTTASSNTPSGGTSSEVAGDDEGLSRMMARTTKGSGKGSDKGSENGADKEIQPKAARAPRAPRVSKAAKKEPSSDDAGSDDAPDEAVT